MLHLGTYFRIVKRRDAIAATTASSLSNIPWVLYTIQMEYIQVEDEYWITTGLIESNCMKITWTHVNACDALHVNYMWMHVMHVNACDAVNARERRTCYSPLHEASWSAGLEQRQPSDTWSTCSSIQRQIKCMHAAATKNSTGENGCAVSKIPVGIKIINQSRKIKGRSRLSLYRRALKRPTAEGLAK